MPEKLSDQDIQTIKTLRSEGLSLRKITRSTGKSLSTVTKYAPLLQEKPPRNTTYSTNSDIVDYFPTYQEPVRVARPSFRVAEPRSPVYEEPPLPPVKDKEPPVDKQMADYLLVHNRTGIYIPPGPTPAQRKWEADRKRESEARDVALRKEQRERERKERDAYYEERLQKNLAIIALEAEKKRQAQQDYQNNLGHNNDNRVTKSEFQKIFHEVRLTQPKPTPRTFELMQQISDDNIADVKRHRAHQEKIAIIKAISKELWPMVGKGIEMLLSKTTNSNKPLQARFIKYRQPRN